jgi:exonuclease VII small subunit
MVLAGIVATAAATAQPAAEASVAPEAAAKVAAAAPEVTAPPEAILYYFHGTFRCNTCLTIEANLAETLKTHFADELASGRLLWLPLNIDESKNAHFEKDYELEGSSAVLVRLEDGDVADWKELEKVWDLYEDGEAFAKYVQPEVAAAIGRVDEADSPRSQPGTEEKRK